ncbi:hypothetical protein BG011_002497 [Mortierella polycephala]|uniref:Uncharacterized protein n=1 Tax=Mortierella polycephala TaxID=41804 RepID=A0A9P6Q4X4_9FUNG|nr:hypothetical protein BG011_002497 [Mortierella polycephala]
MITSSPTPVASTLAREDTIQREHEEAAIAAEAERRKVQHRQQQQQQQQQMQRPAPASRPTHPYQQQQHSQSFVNNHMVALQPLQSQNSSGYLNQGYQQQPYYNHQAQQPPQQHAYTNAETDAYYSNNYAGYNSRSSYDRAPNTPQFQHHGATAPLVAVPGYTEEPGSYVEPPGTSSMPYADYAYGQFNPAETFEDPTSQEAQAHLEYANQLREQQLYHQNMGEALKKQQQLKMQFSRDDSNFPSSGSTTNFFYPQPPQHSSTMSRLPSVPTSSASGAGTYGTGTTHMNTGMVTPGGSTSTDNLRQLCSPQQYPDNVTVAESHYSDDRYKAELLDEVRKTRQEGRESSDNYKVQVGSRGDGGESSGNSRQSTYVPPPM